MIKRLRRPGRSTIGLLLGVVLLAACGGGDTQYAGIEGTGMAAGFGSIYINGIEFSTDGAEIVVNGVPTPPTGLRPGDRVTFTGRIADDGTARADRIVFDRIVDGPIESMDLVASQGTLRALGQTVSITSATTFVNVTPEALARNDLVAVGGFIDANGVLHATSLRRGPQQGAYSAGITPVDVEGIVSNLDIGRRRFQINGLTVDYSGASIATAAGTLSEGAYVQAAGTQGAADDAPLVARRVEVVNRRVGDAGERVLIAGVIRDFNSLDDFRINGQRIDASGAERLDNAAQAPASGVRVLVDGQVRDNVVDADTLRVLPPATRQFTARLDNVKAPAGTITLLGITGRVVPTTVYLERRDNASDPAFRIDDLAPGNAVTVAGYLDAAGDLVVNRVERRNPIATTRLRGPINALDGSNGGFVIAGVTVRVGTTTAYRNRAGDEISRDAFFSTAQPGDRVLATGRENGNRINPASTLRLLPAP